MQCESKETEGELHLMGNNHWTETIWGYSSMATSKTTAAFLMKSCLFLYKTRGVLSQRFQHIILLVTELEKSSMLLVLEIAFKLCCNAIRCVGEASEVLYYSSFVYINFYLNPG